MKSIELYEAKFTVKDHWNTEWDTFGAVIDGEELRFFNDYGLLDAQKMEYTINSRPYEVTEVKYIKKSPALFIMDWLNDWHIRADWLAFARNVESFLGDTPFEEIDQFIASLKEVGSGGVESDVIVPADRLEDYVEAVLSTFGLADSIDVEDVAERLAESAPAVVVLEKVFFVIHQEA